ncbi:dCTP deaminase [Halopseudomonas salina]|uniref:Deoxycytidine triphosphate deaminase n=1 Tax=Halopseudomonas salina TaxID=1323744 RepID=A0ABQ1P6U9_9GAMM|nr:hypothetical protein [Halopseudomonas salina]GGC91973.1 hypothetical protein GCM10007418_09480 [Halopseudomonas salina]
MILPNTVIKNLSPSAGGGLIHPFSDEQLRPSSYDLTVGDEYYIEEGNGALTVETQNLKKKQTLIIPPHAICFLLAAETINLPADVTAKVSLRMTHIYAGMMLTTQPPFDPGYSGKVIVMLHNFSSSPVCIKSGERIATIEFMRLESGVTNLRAHRSVNNLVEQLRQPLISSLRQIANSSKDAQDKVAWLSGQMVIFAALIVAILAIPGLLSYNALFDRLGDQTQRSNNMDVALDQYREELRLNKLETEKLRVQMTQLQSRSSSVASSPEAEKSITGETP